jgi:hypothetical protein
VAEVFDERIVSADGLRLPTLAVALALRVEESHPRAPHLREERNVRAQRACATAEEFSFGKVRGPVCAAPRHLQQSHPDRFHRDSLNRRR